MSDSIKLHTMDLFSRFFQENQEKFLTFAYSYLRDKAEAEDVLMESMGQRNNLRDFIFKHII